MIRREFITLLGGAAAWPLAARAQQPGRMPRVGVLMAFDENDPEANRYLSGFTQGLAELGWTNGRNVRMDFRWSGDDTNLMVGFPSVDVAVPRLTAGRRSKSRSRI